MANPCQQIASSAYRQMNDLTTRVRNAYKQPHVVAALPADFAATTTMLEMESRIDQAAQVNDYRQTKLLIDEYLDRVSVYCYHYMLRISNFPL